MLLPLILARLCGHWDVCEHKLMSLFALGAPRVASCGNSHQRFPVPESAWQQERSVLKGSPLGVVSEGESSGKHLARCRRFFINGVPSGVVRGGEFRKAPGKVQEVLQ